MKRLTVGAWGSGLLGLSLLSLALPGPASARELSESEVRAALPTWVKYCTVDAKADAEVERIDSRQAGGRTVAYIVQFKGGGYCLVNADDQLLPVCLYVTAGSFDPLNSRQQEFLEDIASRNLAFAQAAQGKAVLSATTLAQGDDHAQLWQSLIAGQNPVARAKVSPKSGALSFTVPVAMALPLTSIWSQGAPWNNLAPVHPIANQHTLAGCNAIAQAQIMYYWKWPPAGTGSASVTYEYRWRYDSDFVNLNQNPAISIPGGWESLLTWDGMWLWMSGNWDQDRYRQATKFSDRADYQAGLLMLWNQLHQGTVTSNANFATTYHWALMADTYPNNPASEAEVAKLCAHAGISSQSDYGLSSTGSSFSRWPLATNFFYSYDLQWFPGITNQPTTEAGFITELQWLRPVALGGSGRSGGHAYVVYGYDTTYQPNPYFLMNFGWGDAGEAHHWMPLNESADYFPNGQDHLTHIAPADAVHFVGAGSPGTGSPTSPHQNIEEAIRSVPNGGTLIFKAGTKNTFSANQLVINRPMVLKGYQSTITR